MPEKSFLKRATSTLRCSPCVVIWTAAAALVAVSFFLPEEKDSTRPRAASAEQSRTSAAPPRGLPADQQPKDAEPPIARNALGREISVPAPHPIISEIYFEVLTPLALADANGDGARSSTGDEFIELWNPHDEAVNLEGYTLTDRNPEPAQQTRFTFPPLVLEPGQVVVVFNGREWSPSGPVGTEASPPPSTHPDFHGAWVFTMNVKSKLVALSNETEFVLLTDPTGQPIDCVSWGDPEPAPPANVLRLNVVQSQPAGSVQRLTPAGPLLEHADIDQTPFSPGRIPIVSDSPKRD